MTIKNFKKINDWLWEIPKNFRKDMNVPARIFMSEKMIGDAHKDRSFEQLVNVATLRGIVKYSLAMPDMHEGYGFTIGGVAAMDTQEGVISPGGVGYDINCGMRLLTSDLEEEELVPYLEKLANEIQKQVPSGLGQGRKIKFGIEELNKILEGGSQKLAENGYGKKEDIDNCESNGCLEEADAGLVSSRAKNRAFNQAGTLGSGNHFLEIQRVDKIFDQKIAKIFGLFKNQVVIMIHSGSRALGHQVASDYIKSMTSVLPKYKIKIPDKELVSCPFSSPEGQQYFKAMCASANFAWANRQMITHYTRQAWKNILGERKTPLKTLYDVAHNIAKVEKHNIDGKEKEVLVHRKGATRAFPPGHAEIPENYKETGQPILIPGSMGTASYVLTGTQKAAKSFYSTCHGAGRSMSRRAAIRSISTQQVSKELKQKKILIKTHSLRGIAEEAPQAYKDIEEVIEVVHNAELSKKVARLVPLAVIKGE